MPRIGGGDLPKILLVVCIVLSAVAIPVGLAAAQTEQVIGSPGISASVQDNHIITGEQNQISIAFSNGGNVVQSGPEQFVQRVETARNARVSIDESGIDAPIDVKTGTVPLGALQGGSVQQAQFTVEPGEDLEPGRYTIPIEVQYSHTRIVNYETSPSGPANIEYVDSSRTATKTVELVVDDQANFVVTPDTENQISVGDTDEYDFSVRNTGNQQASNISLQLTSENPAVRFGTGQEAQSQTSVYIPSLAPGARHNGSVRMTATQSSSVGEYPIQTVVNYETPSGIAATEQRTASVAIDPEQQFRLSNVSSSLRVDAEGDITATVTNEGPRTATDAVIQLQSTANGIQPERTDVPLDRLEPGDSTSIEFPVSVNDNADAGPYQFGFDVAYQDADGDKHTSDVLNSQITVGEKRDIFTVTGSNTSLEAGSSGLIELTLTNNDDETLRNINAKAFVDDPLSASSDEAFIPVLEPGENATIGFDISAAGDASPQSRPLELDFQYEETDGDTVLSDTYQVAVDLTPASDDGGSVSPIVLIVVGGIIVIGAYMYFRRR